MRQAIRIERLAFWISAVAASLLHWIPHFPPQIDLAQHAAQMRFLVDWTDPDFALRSVLELHLFTPYLPAYALGALLGRLMPMVAAVNVIWSLGAFGTIAATVWLRRRLNGDARWDWLVIPGLFGPTFVWGLLTFQLAVPLGLLWLGGWIANIEAPSRRRGVLVALGLCLLFFCHALLTAWVLLTAGAMLLGYAMRDRLALRDVVARSIPLMVPLPLAVIWFLRSRDTAQAGEPVLWDLGLQRLAFFFSDWLGLPFGMVGLLLGAALLFSPFVGGVRLARFSVLHVPLIVTLVIVLAVPHTVFGTAVTSYRFYSLLGPSLVIAFAGAGRDDSPVRLARLVPPAVTLATLGTLALNLRAFDMEQRAFQRILALMEPGRRVLSAPQFTGSWALPFYPWYQHFPVWYQVEKGGLVEFSFSAYEYPAMVRFRREFAPIPMTFAQEPRLELVRDRLTKFDYVLVRSRPGENAPLPSWPVELIARDGLWWLYGTARSAGPDRAHAR